MQIYVGRDGQREGPFTLDEVRARLASGASRVTDLAWYEGAPGWIAITALPGLGGPPPLGASTAPVPQPMGPGAAPSSGSGNKTCLIVGIVVAAVGLGLVAIIALLAAIAVPNFARARKRSQATATLETLRLIDGAMDQYAIETNRDKGFAMNWADLAPYVPANGSLHQALLSGEVKDVLGHRIEITPIDHPPKVPEETVRDTSSVISDPASFWGPYYPDAK